MRRGAGRAPAARGAADYLPGLLQAGVAFRQNDRRVVSRPGGADRRRIARSIGGKSVRVRPFFGRGASLGAVARTHRSAFASAAANDGSLETLEASDSDRRRPLRLL